MILSQLLKRAQVHPVAHFGDAEITGIQIDSRKCSPGCLFVCMPGGANSDSHQFIPAAQANGASAALTYSREGFEIAHSHGMPAILVEDVRDAIWRICDHFFEHPTRHLKVVGITGTNGKTTTAWLVRDMLAAFGLKAGYLGTLGFQYPGFEMELPNTTPFTVDLYNLLAQARHAGVEAIAMEVSSHALAEKRVEGVEFDVAVFTNLTQDHLDYHGTMAEYESAKRRLFVDLPKLSDKPFRAAINVGDPTGARWAQDIPCLAYRLVESEVDYASGSLHGCIQRLGIDHLDLELSMLGQADATAKTRLGGSYNAENLLSACAAVYALAEGSGLTQDRSQTKLDLVAQLASAVHPVPGRFEPVSNDRRIGILVDYAHTPDAIKKLLAAARPLTPGRVITVFGCGGDRDRTKRPLMAQAAAKGSDIVVITSDNPRTEDPQAILRDVAAGLPSGCEAQQIEDRAEAVAAAIRMAHPGDTVVIAGKGHENYQIIGRQKFPMDDRELARRALAS